MTLISKYLPCRQVPVLLVVIALAGCTRQVSVDGNWKEGVSHDQSFGRVLVVALSSNVNQRCDFERFMVTQIRATGAEAKTSCSLMDTGKDLNRATIEPVVADYGADAVLTTVLVHSDPGVRAGGDRETRGGLYGKATGTGYASYYGGYYGVPVVYGEIREAPVVTSVAGEANILSLLYATSDATLVYELETTAHDMHSRDDALASITPRIAERLQREGLLRGNQ